MPNAGSLTSILFIVVMFAFLYFFMIRPQRKQQQKHQSMLSKIKRGDKVTTIGRLHGVVDEVNEADKTVTLDCDGIFLVFDLNAIAKIAPADEGTSHIAAKSDATSAESSAASSESTAAESADSQADDPESK
ncbi:preprotein translocase subunit YajC [Lactiplantibacillus xiangfangensis]|uniref:Translocase subunit n=1 Tax=Lactiplantibacillus xiangfangensis TaxID=942150 RepID=A0A0R2M1V4_9LACO|nr:preprotein translocase subunit YajC [Lactiplantibacillus xiangfangensis]KRO07446.1 translocase subunit [Lactiplantibacillus xiangfangensis]